MTLPRILAILLALATLAACVDGNTGKIYLCPSNRCKVN